MSSYLLLCGMAVGLGLSIGFPIGLVKSRFMCPLMLPLLMNGFADKSTAHIFAAVIPAQTFLAMLVISVIPATIFMLCLHHVARAIGRRSAWEYAAIGGTAAFVCALLLAFMAPLLAVLTVPAAFCGAVMGALYRRFAGLEPVPLPEPVIATDPEALVGADHPSRHQHGVILSN